MKSDNIYAFKKNKTIEKRGKPKAESAGHLLHGYLRLVRKYVENVTYSAPQGSGRNFEQTKKLKFRLD